ncbi:MAG TPA: hypothetical protein VEK76_10645 [Candidatus Binatia bacterium]|nr:hypothetical protein [Candidatus Binatia bacterium]
MNPVVALSALLALAVFPGAAYAGVTALAACWLGRMPPGAAPARVNDSVAAFAAVAACGLLALPGSPLTTQSIDVSLVGLLLGLVVGVAWGTSPRWEWHRGVAAAAALVALLALAAPARTLDLRILALVPRDPSRPWAVAAILLALPAVVRPFDPATSRAGRAALVGAIALLAMSIAALPPLGGISPPAVAALCAALTMAYAGLLGVLRPVVTAALPLLGLLAVVPAAVALGLAL